MEIKISHLILLILSCLFLGFFVGLNCGQKLCKIETKTETRETKVEKVEKVDVSQTQKDSNLSQLTSYTEKFYNDKGILTHEIVKTHDMVSSETALETKSSDVKKTSVSELESQTIVKSVPLPRWEFGIFTNAENLEKPREFKFKDFNLLVDYRLFGNFKWMASTNFRELDTGFITSF